VQRYGFEQSSACLVADPLQSGGEAWTLAEKAKIADLNWRIVAEKPRA
jgi:hypothetical protein